MAKWVGIRALSDEICPGAWKIKENEKSLTKSDRYTVPKILQVSARTLLPDLVPKIQLTNLHVGPSWDLKIDEHGLTMIIARHGMLPKFQGRVFCRTKKLRERPRPLKAYENQRI